MSSELKPEYEISAQSDAEKRTYQVPTNDKFEGEIIVYNTARIYNPTIVVRGFTGNHMFDVNAVQDDPALEHRIKGDLRTLKNTRDYEPAAIRDAYIQDLRLSIDQFITQVIEAEKKIKE